MIKIYKQKWRISVISFSLSFVLLSLWGSVFFSVNPIEHSWAIEVFALTFASIFFILGIVLRDFTKIDQ